MKWKERKSENETTWYKEIQEMIERSKLKIINRRLRAPKITQNVIIMEIAIEFINEMEFLNKYYNKIN